MRINYLRPISDIHLDVDVYYHPRANGDPKVWEPPVHEKDPETALVIAGDIWLEDRCVNWLVNMARRYAAVVCVLGNHDYWGDCINVLPAKLQAKVDDELEYLGRVKNVFILQNTGITLDNIEFAGGTLWTDFNGQDPLTRFNWRLIMTKDAIKIRYLKGGTYARLHTEDLIAEHKKTMGFITEFEKTRLMGTRKKVVITHHAPTFKCILPMYQAAKVENGYYATEYFDTIWNMTNLDYWFFGHIHNAFDETIGTCRLVCNPRGYAKVGDGGFGWNPNLLLKVER